MARCCARLAIVALLAVVPAACSTSPPDQLPSAVSAANGSTQITSAARTARSESMARGLQRSWMSPEAKGQNLMYISDFMQGAVFVYTYPKAKLVGSIGGLATPEGMCTDAKGNIWIANTTSNQISEYAHGGTTPITTITQTEQLYVDCSVDPNTGTLAVASLCQEVNYICISPGSIFVYKNLTKPPVQYQVNGAADVVSCGYDAKSNLFVDATGTVSDPFVFGELASGASAVSPITLDRPIYYPGGVRWDGKYLAVGDQEVGNQNTSAVHQVKVSGSQGTVVSTISLHGTGDAVGFALQGSTIVVANIGIGGPSDFRLYNYPAGGKPTLVVSGGFAEPIGAAVSLAPKQRHGK